MLVELFLYILGIDLKLSKPCSHHPEISLFDLHSIWSYQFLNKGKKVLKQNNKIRAKKRNFKL